MNPNVLRQYLDLYDKQGMGGGMGGGYNGGFDPYGVLDFANKMNAGTAAGARQMWAERMASDQRPQQQAPDFFSDQPQNALAPYRRPMPFDANTPADPMMGRGPPAYARPNYLAQMMRR